MGFLNKLFTNKENDPENYFEQGKKLILKGDLDEGIKLFRKAIGLHPYLINRIFKITSASRYFPIDSSYWPLFNKSSAIPSI